MDNMLFAAVAFVAAVAFIHFLRPFFVKAGLVDRPDASRKLHADPVPLLGGLGILAGFLAASLLMPVQGNGLLGPLLFALMPLVAVGLWDDFSEARTLVRLIAQVLSALVMVYVAGVVIRDLGSLIHADHPVILHSWAVPLTIFCTVGAINAVNMIDGLDGLAGGVVLIALGWFAVAGAIVGDRFDTALAVVFMGAVAGFLAFNLRNPLRKQASVFLGDTGSMVLGFMLAWFSVRLTQVEGGGLMPMAGVWIIGLPLLDTLSVIVWRSVRGRSPLSADRNHLHYVLLRAGFSPRQTVAILLLVALAFGGFGVGVWLAGLPDSILFWGSLAVYAVYLAVMWRVWPAMESRADAQRS